jgi:uncharacterized protein YndB with AHSA1/START domain
MITYDHAREIPAPIEKVFAAFAPERLVRWWGPDGFTNRSEHCDFRAGGNWKFVMRGPDGKEYPNECSFDEVVPPTKVVVRKLDEPHFTLTIGLTPTPGGTRVTWSQAFASDDMARRLEKIVLPANEQNLARLAAEVARV